MEPDQPATATAAQSISRRYVLLALVAFALLVIAVVILLRVFVAERIPLLTAERLVAAEEHWAKHGLASYDMNIEIRGAQPGVVHIEVRDGEPTAMTRDSLPPPRRTWDVWTVLGMFELLQQEMILAEDPQVEMGAAKGATLRLRCEFDPEYGFPRRYHRHSTGGAPEVYFRVTEFLPR